MKTPLKGVFIFMRQKTALISVYNKEGIADFAKGLVDLGWKIISSGGTAKHLSGAGIPVTDVAEITGVPAILSHRVVTLHPKIQGGLLALNNPEHLAELEKYGIPYIDIVCCDLYPLEEEVSKKEATRESVIEKTDIGGPTMLRAGAKGGRIVICDPDDRKKVLNWLREGEKDREDFVNKLRAKAEETVARYASLSAEYHGAGIYKNIFGKKMQELAYGENAYQTPAYLYRAHGGGKDPLAISNWKLLEGSPLSYNNICDLDRMMQTMIHIGAGFEKNFNEVPCVAIGVKHGNACGAGISESNASAELEAIDKMLVGDLRAIFGGSVMLNFPVDEKIAEELIHKYAGESRRLLDIVAGPSFTDEAVEMLSRKKGKCRLLANPAILKAGLSSLDTARKFRYVRGGFLEQPNYSFVPDLTSVLSWKREEEHKDIVLAWAIGCTSNSNTITIVKDGRLYGNGVGQQDRVGAAKLAIFRADESNNGKADLEGAVAYSDSFFPFPDAPEVLIERGIKTIFSTSGSVNDEKTIELCKNKGVNLILLPDTEARGFYQH
jgi:phosphoribosylaminoimidazolecarboxamide formyltransferase/IMP cyclohydrolase